MSSTIFKRSIRNSAILALVIAVIAIYQGETHLTAGLSFAFSWLVLFFALFFSYKLSNRITKQEDTP